MKNLEEFNCNRNISDDGIKDNIHMKNYFWEEILILLTMV